MENGVTPEGNSASLSLDEGAHAITSILSGAEPEKKQAPERDAGEPEVQANEADAPDHVEETTDQGESNQEEPEQSDEAAPDDDQQQEPKFRLKDGTEVTLDEVEEWRKGNLRDADYRRKTMELSANRKELETKVSEITQKTQFFEQQANLAIEIAQQYLPQAPDPAMLQSDPIGYLQQKATYDSEVGKLQQLVAAKQMAEQERQAKLATEIKGIVTREAEALVGAVSDLRDPAKREKFVAEIKQTARDYGYTDADVNNVRDHRLFLMARDAGAYRRLMANRPKAQAKAQTAAPMQKPGVRTGQKEPQARASKENWDRLRKTGSIDDGAAVLLDLIR